MVARRRSGQLVTSGSVLGSVFVSALAAQTRCEVLLVPAGDSERANLYPARV